MFIGHPEAGERSAVIYMGQLSPARPRSIRLLKDLFTRLPAAKITEIKQFTPRAWGQSKGEGGMDRSGSLSLNDALWVVASDGARWDVARLVPGETSGERMLLQDTGACLIVPSF